MLFIIYKLIKNKKNKIKLNCMKYIWHIDALQ